MSRLDEIRADVDAMQPDRAFFANQQAQWNRPRLVSDADKAATDDEANAFERARANLAYLLERLGAAERVCRSLALDRMEALVLLNASEQTEACLETWINDHDE